MKIRFGELPIGARFCYRAHRYEKMTSVVGRHEENGGSVFHPNTEVVPMQNEGAPYPVPSPHPMRRGSLKLAPPGPPEIPWEPRSRLPSDVEREMIDAALRQFTPSRRPLPSWHGTYSEESSERKNYGTGD